MKNEGAIQVTMYVCMYVVTENVLNCTKNFT